MPPDLKLLLHPRDQRVLIHSYERVVVLAENLDESIADFSTQLREAGLQEVESWRLPRERARFRSADGFDVHIYTADRLVEEKTLLIVDVGDHPTIAPTGWPEFGRDRPVG